MPKTKQGKEIAKALGTSDELTLADIYKIANEAYGDQIIYCLTHQTSADVGDGLAKFIVDELKETFIKTATNAEKLEDAIRLFDVARNQLTAIADELRIKLKEVQDAQRS